MNEVDKAAVTEITINIQIPDTAQVVFSMIENKTMYRFYAMPTFEEGRTSFSTEHFRKIVDIILDASENPVPMPDNLTFEAYVFCGDDETVLRDLTYDKLEHIAHFLSSEYPDYGLLNPFL